VNLAVHAEWTKLRTVAGSAWLLLAAVSLTVALGAAADSASGYSALGPAQDTTKISLTGVYLGQAVVAVLAVLAVGSEYSSGTIHTTLAAVPRRCTMLAAKAVALLAAVIPAAAVGVLCSLVAGRLILPGSGFTPAHGYTSLSLADGSTLRATAGSVIYLALIALLALGVTAAVRDSATAIGIVLGVLYLFPIVAQVVGDPHWQRRLHEIAPMTAGLYIQATIGVHSLPLSPWQGLGVLAGWATAALVAGGVLLGARDA
jgi:ABC-2 type transport system permease protein